MIKRILEYIKPKYKWALFSGVLVGCSYIPFPPWALFFCYVPLWISLVRECQSWKQAFRAAWWTQFILSLIGFHWIAHLAHEFGFLPWPIAVLILLIFSALMHLYIPIASAIAWQLSKKWHLQRLTSFFLLAGLMTLAEMYWPSIFNWNLGYPMLWAQWPLAQWADTIGFQGLSFAVYLINAVISWLILSEWQRRESGSKIHWLPSKIWLIIFASLVVILLVSNQQGAEKRQFWQNKVQNSKQQISILVAQANIGNLEKFYAEKGMGYQQYIIDQFFNLTRQGLLQSPNADLILWPESAFPDYLDPFAENRKYPRQFRQFIKSIQKPILTGAYSKDAPGMIPRHDYNGIFLFNQNAELIPPVYHKTQLLIFGEYLPLVEQLPILAKWNPGGTGFGRGPGPTVFNFTRQKQNETLTETPTQTENITETIKLGLQICYESLDPLFSTALSKKQAQILVNVTNDSWFGERFEPWQHLYMTLARGLENRLPLIRATNTGITTAILADGTVLEHSPIYQQWAHSFDITYQTDHETTFYTRWANWLWLAVTLFISTCLLLDIIIKKRRH